jgi:hypothetical protein
MPLGRSQSTQSRQDPEKDEGNSSRMKVAGAAYRQDLTRPQMVLASHFYWRGYFREPPGE